MRLLITILGTLLTITSINCAWSQVIWTETFSAGSAARGTSAVNYPGSSGGIWTQTTNILGGGEGASANRWYVSGEECGNAAGSCGSVCANGDASLHVSAIGGLCGTPDCGAAYDETSAANRTDKRIESPAINTTGYGGLTLSFNYIAAQGDDDVTVLYSCNGGASWTALPALGATQCCDCNDAFLCSFLGICCGGITTCGGGQGYWTNQTYALPVCAENISNLKIAFHWFNNGNGIGTDPSIAIDDISITSTTPLAARLISFTGEQTQTGNLLNWSTASEENNAYFEIQRRTHGDQFETIGKVDGSGTTTTEQNYHFTDRYAPDAGNYYRLRMIDYNNQVTLSDIIYVGNSSFELSRIYPNPTNDQVTIDIHSSVEQRASLHVIDNQGRFILEESIRLTQGMNSMNLDVQNLDKGSYRLLIRTSEKTYSESLMIY